MPKPRVEALVPDLGTVSCVLTHHLPSAVAESKHPFYHPACRMRLTGQSRLQSDLSESLFRQGRAIYEGNEGGRGAHKCLSFCIDCGPRQAVTLQKSASGVAVSCPTFQLEYLSHLVPVSLAETRGGTQ
jgi:hypothetical protein